jgi:hypothetical protein
MECCSEGVCCSEPWPYQIRWVKQESCSTRRKGCSTITPLYVHLFVAGLVLKLRRGQPLPRVYPPGAVHS